MKRRGLPGASLCATAAALLACAPPPADLSFTLWAVEPSSARRLEEPALRILGAPFYARTTQVIGRRDPLQDDAYRAWLGDTELQDVRRLATDALTAKVPGTLGLGSWTLRVESPFGEAATLERAFEVREIEPAALAGSLLARDRVNLGQQFPVRLLVDNRGGQRALAVTPSALAFSSASLSAASGPSPAAANVVEPGGSASFEWVVRGAALGTATVRAGASGVDAASGVRVQAPEASSSAVVVERRARLDTSALVAPERVTVGTDYRVSFMVSNTGDSAALFVVATALSCSGTGSGTPVDGPTPASATVVGLGLVQITYTVRAVSRGSWLCSASATGIDRNDGDPVSTGTVTARTTDFET